MDYQTIERVKKGLSNPEIGPETLALMLTERCNLNCQYCRGGRDSESRGLDAGISQELSTEELFKLFEDACYFKVKEINLGGMNGEPFCKKDILKIMRRIKQCGFLGSITTNGSFLNADIAGIITEYKWDIMHLSFDSCDESIQHALRPSLNKKPYFKNIIEFLDTINNINSSLRILLNVVVNKLNYRAFPKLVKFADDYKNIESINVLRMIDTKFKNYRDIQLSTEELIEFKTILSKINSGKVIYQDYFLNDACISQTNNFGHQDTSRPFPAEKFKGCFTNYYILSVDSNGDVIQCPQYQKRIQGLNVRKTSLKDLWLNEHLLFRQRLVEYAPCFDGCCTILKEQNKLIHQQINNGKGDY